MATTDSPAWRKLAAHATELARVSLRDLFAADPDRPVRMAAQVGDLHVDWSRQRVTDRTLRLLGDLAAETALEDRIRAMFAGEPINTTEGRPVLHVALRAPRTERIIVGGRDVVADVHEVLDRMEAFARAVRDGTWRGATGEPVRTVVNIGIGGSDLGPRMAARALAPWMHPRIRLRFVSNIDGDALGSVLEELDPATTLFVVSSKSFTTTETLHNARSARRWVTGSLGPDATSRHFVAVSTNARAVADFGIDPANMFGFWDWVGGRYSMDSAIGLALMVGIGPEAFREMLGGFRCVDEHFRDTPLAGNVPAILGMIAVWNRSVLGWCARAVIPYADRLALLPAYLSQLDMESNGKRVHLDGTPVDHETGPVVFGQPGTDAQHAFFQLLHQGTTVVPVDLIGFARPHHDPGGHQDLLVANLVAQATALAFGRTAEETAATGVPPELVAHRTFPGDRPSTVILAPALTPAVLGQLVALYEHQTFVQGVLWGINSFDQWGVELGKELAREMAASLAGTGELDVHPSARPLLEWYRRLRDGGASSADPG